MVSRSLVSLAVAALDDGLESTATFLDHEVRSEKSLLQDTRYRLEF